MTDPYETSNRFVTANGARFHVALDDPVDARSDAGDEPPVLAGSRSFFAKLAWTHDVDADGHADVITVDMLPEDNFRKKTMLPANRIKLPRRSRQTAIQTRRTSRLLNTMQLSTQSPVRIRKPRPNSSVPSTCCWMSVATIWQSNS